MKRAIAVGILLICLAILGVLGTWQSSRFLGKLELFSTMEERLPLPAVEVSSASQLVEPLDFRTVRPVGGELLRDRTALVQRRFHKHLPGHWTVTPYRFADDSVVLLHTGWIPEDHPEMAANRPPGELAGLVFTPKKTMADELARANPRWELADQPYLGELDSDFLYGHLAPLTPPPRLETFIVFNGAEQLKHYPMPSPQYITEPYLTPAMHLGYATLWFGSALLMCWLFWAGWTGRLDPSAR